MSTASVDATDQPHTPDIHSIVSEDSSLLNREGEDVGGAAALPTLPAEVAGAEEPQQVAGAQDSLSEHDPRDPDGGERH